MNQRRQPVEYAAGTGLVLGAGIGIVIGVIVGGGIAVAAGITIGGALGLLVGATAGLRHRPDREMD